MPYCERMTARLHPAPSGGFAPAFVAGVLDDALSHRARLYAIAGLQGTGKSTLAAQVAALAHARGLRAAVLSIDDFYLGKRDRQRRLLLMRLEAAMPGGHLLEMTDDVTVEHVLPKSGGAWWNERFPDSGMRNDAANLLGNLVLVTFGQNTIADTKPYPDKRKVFFNTHGAPIFALTRDIVGIEEWTLQAIEERQRRSYHRAFLWSGVTHAQFLDFLERHFPAAVPGAKQAATLFA